MTGSTDARRAQVPVWVAALALCLLLGLQPLTTDLYLPTLPVLATQFAAPMTALQMTMAATILSFGLGQLAWGPVSDRFGRRPVLLSGLAIYVLASIGAALAHSIDWLILMRAVQGATMAAAVVCGRAMVRDLYEPLQGTHVMARGLTGLGLVAVTGPALGGWLTGHVGWRAAFGAIALFATAALIFIVRQLPETLPQRNLQALQPAPLLRNWLRMPRDRSFAGYAALAAFSYSGLIAYLASSSFVLCRQLGLNATQYGLTLMLVSSAFVSGTVLCRRLLRRLGMAGTARRGALLCLLAGLLLIGNALAGVHAVWAVLLPQFVYGLGHGINQPCCQTGVIAAFPREAGTASSLAGALLALLGFCTTWWLGHALGDSMMPALLGQATLGILACVVAFTVLPSDRPAPRAAALPS
jgi:DHA1 family bicyclomycin/chloramphenicol resistance-like MFS transporter